MKYIDRQGNKKENSAAEDTLLRFLYTTVPGRMLLSPLVRPSVSRLAGKFLSTKLSRIFIRPFIRSNHIDMSEYERTSYASYNDFFTRKIKSGARTIPAQKDVLISPCDCYASAYPLDTNSILTVKHTKYTLKSLLHSQKLASHYAGGTALILRLTVSDYHRYSYAVTGKLSKNHVIPGKFHTVNPIANDYFPVYKENSREFIQIHTEHLGNVIQMEVGALMVGKIVNHTECASVLLGEEKGYFEFGGSTIILLLEKDSLVLRSDLLPNTANGYETKLRLGDIIGTPLL